MTAVREIIASAETLEAWHESGCRGERPPGRLRPHEIERVDPLTRLWAEPAYRMIFDPDGRSYADRLPGTGDVIVSDWFLTGGRTRQSRPPSCPPGARATRAEPLIHGATYFDHLATEVEALRAGDHLSSPTGAATRTRRCATAGRRSPNFLPRRERGVVVKGLVWRSHLDKFAYSEEENQHLGEGSRQAGGEVLLDQRVRFGGRIIRSWSSSGIPGPGTDVAFAGGIDLCHSRRDDESITATRRRSQMAKIRRTPPWHDVQLRCRGRWWVHWTLTFRERWNDPAPLDMLSRSRGFGTSCAVPT